MNPDQIIEWLKIKEITISRKTLLNYEAKGIIHPAERGSFGRGKGRYAEYPDETCYQVFAAWHVLNTENVQLESLVKAVELATWFEKYPVDFYNSSRISTSAVLSPIMSELQAIVEDAVFLNMLQWIAYLNIAAYGLPSYSTFYVEYNVFNQSVEKRVSPYEIQETIYKTRFIIHDHRNENESDRKPPIEIELSRRGL